MKVFINNNSIFINNTISGFPHLFTFPLKGTSFSLIHSNSDINLVAKSVNNELVIQIFRDETIALNTFKKIIKKIHRYGFMSKVKVWVDYGFKLGWIFLFSAFILSINGMFNNYLVLNNRNTSNPTPTVPTSNISIKSAPQIKQADNSVVNIPSKLKALKSAVNSKQFTVSLSSGKKHTLYVFSDPLCPYCKKLEPKLDKVAEFVNIEVFPVSVISRDKSTQYIEQILSKTDTERTQLWKKLMSDHLINVNDGDYATQRKNIEANNLAFQMLGFDGTPTILLDTGYIVPTQLFDNPNRLKELLEDDK